MSHFRFQSLLLLSSLALAASGCEKKTEPAPADAPSASASTSASAAASASAAPKVDSAVENPPEGCPTKNSLVVQSKEAGKVKPGHANSYFIQWGKSKDRGQLVTANYAVDPNNVYRKIKDKEVLVVVKVRHEDKSPIAKGTFVKRSEPETEGGEKPNKRAPEFNISTDSIG